MPDSVDLSKVSDCLMVVHLLLWIARADLVGAKATSQAMIGAVRNTAAVQLLVNPG
jgi:hypothetical protein